jgi:hypothetical protein
MPAAAVSTVMTGLLPIRIVAIFASKLVSSKDSPETAETPAFPVQDRLVVT